MNEEALTNMKELRALENKYGYIPFCMALTHLFDKGYGNFNEKFVEEGFKAILAEEEADKKNGTRSFVSPDLKRGILRCCAELAKYSILTLFAYIKEHITVDL